MATVFDAKFVEKIQSLINQAEEHEKNIALERQKLLDVIDDLTAHVEDLDLGMDNIDEGLRTLKEGFEALVDPTIHSDLSIHE